MLQEFYQVPSSTKAMEPLSTMSNVTDATSTSCHDLDIQDICHKASYLMQSVMPNETFHNCTKIFQVFSKKPWFLSLYMFVLKSQLILLIKNLLKNVFFKKMI